MRIHVLLVATRPVVDKDESVVENRIDGQERPEQKETARCVDAILAMHELQSKRQALSRGGNKNRKRFRLEILINEISRAFIEDHNRLRFEIRRPTESELT